MATSMAVLTPTTKKQLQDYLLQAAALEHSLLCAYLFTAYTLKQDLSEVDPAYPNIDPKELAALNRTLGAAKTWNRLITDIATQEMLHLALACNMVAAIDGVPEFRRGELNFPITPAQMEHNFGYHGGAYLSLWPFSKETIERYAWFEAYEHPNSSSFPGSPWGDSPKRDHKMVELVPGFVEMQDSPLVELYKAIARGFVLQNNKSLFSGDKAKQVTDLEVTGLFNYPPAVVKNSEGKEKNVPLLTPVTDLKSALIAINTIILQGEGSGESDHWEKFMKDLCSSIKGEKIDYDSFPKIGSPSHEKTFKAILHGGPLQGQSQPVIGIDQCSNWEFFVRYVGENPLNEDPCNGDPACERHVHITTIDFTRDVADLFNNLYGVMIDLLVAGFGTPSDTTQQEPEQSDEDYFKVRTYEKTTLIQASIRSMVYLMSPLANALTQLPASEGFYPPRTAGPGFVHTPSTEDLNWEYLSNKLKKLSDQAIALVEKHPEPSKLLIWIRPSYYDVPLTSGNPEARHGYPYYSLKKLLMEALAADLLFLSDRLKFVKGNAPPKKDGERYPQHVCYGLNACKGQDITGKAIAPGVGKCATADPHVCAQQNHCKGQGGCGFSYGYPTSQNKPGQNCFPGQIKIDGYWMPNPDSDSACGSPILPGTHNTHGYNTAYENLGGKPDIYNQAQGYVWEFARLLFDYECKYEKGIDVQPSDYIERYRTPFKVDDNDE